MEVILRESIASLGNVGEIVKVKTGYARNYLIPKRLAYQATDANRKRLEAERAALEAKETQHHEAAAALAAKVEAVTLSIAKEAGEEDKLFGSVTSSDVDEALKKEGIEIDRKMITFHEAIRTLGEHEVEVRVHAGVSAKCKLQVVRSLSSVAYPEPKAAPIRDPLDRVPPNNLEAEQAVLGSILLDNEAVYRIMEIVRIEDFYRPSHRIIYAAVLELLEKSEPVDLVTLTNHLETRGDLETVGGRTALTSLVDGVPTAASVGPYATIVREKSVLRKLIQVATEIVSQGYGDAGEVDHFVDQAEKMIFDIAQNKISQSLYKVADIVRDTYAAIEEQYERKEAVTGLSTGFVDLDRLTSGLQPSDLIIVAGRPSMGKTALALNIALNASRAGKVPVAIFSLEMSKEQLVQRLICQDARVDASKLRTGFLSRDDWSRITAAAGQLAETDLFIDDTPATSSLAIRAKARRLHREHGLGLIVVDYLQLMRGVGKVESREREISEISMSLKALAKELHIPVIALSQLNRMVENRRPPIPQLADLRESGAIEQDADLIAFIYREEVYDKETLNKGVAEIILGKQRNGPTGTIRLQFEASFTRFGDMIHDIPQDIEGGV